MSKKGFTLIELLAVIVILAIIALIATPIVLNIINESKESAQLRSAEMYLKGVETSVASAIIHEKNVKDGIHPITPIGDICLGILQGTGKTATCNGKVLEVQMNGEKPESGSITISSGKVTNLTFTYKNEKTIVKNSEDKLVYEVKLAPGLYDSEGNMTMSWQELIAGGYLFVNNGVLVADTWESGNYTGLAVEGLNDGTLIIDKTINEIANYGFYATLIKNVQLPNTINKIGSTAFAHTSIEEITLPNTVTVLNGTFCSCYELKIINYNGTKKEWNNIEKSTQILVGENHYQGIDWNEECPQITVHCTDGDIEIPANN